MPTPTTYSKINAGVQQPKNHVSDQKWSTLLVMPAGLHHLAIKSKESRNAIKQGQEGSYKLLGVINKWKNLSDEVQLRLCEYISSCKYIKDIP